MKGYKEAEKIDKQIIALLEKEKVTKENAREWLVFIRTIATTLEIIRILPMEILKQGKEEKNEQKEREVQMD